MIAVFWLNWIAENPSQIFLKILFIALKDLDAESKINLYTDSKYVKEGITSWINGWKKNNWTNSNKKDVKNKDLWIELDILSQKHNITWNWVKGHSGNIENDIADKLATEAIGEN